MPSIQAGTGRHVSNGAVEAPLVVEINVNFDFQPSLPKIRQPRAADALRLEGLVPTLNLAVALRVVDGSGHMAVAVHGDELLELLSDKLPPVVRDVPWTGQRERLPGSLLYNPHVARLHGREEPPCHNEPAAPVDDGDHVVGMPPDVHVCDVHVPVLVHTERLLETASLPGRLPAPVANGAEATEDLVDRRRLHVDDVRIHHHVCASPVAVLEVLLIELHDASAFPILEPVAVRGVAPVAVRHARAPLPVVVPLAGDADQGAKAADGRVRALRPLVYEGDNPVPEVVFHPAV